MTRQADGPQLGGSVGLTSNRDTPIDLEASAGVGRNVPTDARSGGTPCGPRSSLVVKLLPLPTDSVRIRAPVAGRIARVLPRAEDM